jgi:integrase
MPRVPKGMFKRGRSWYVRLFDNGTDRWISLGSEFEEATRTLRKLRAGDLPVARLSVCDAAERWVATYCATARNPKGVNLARRRVALYLASFFRGRELSAVTPEELRRYRLWLEGRIASPQTVAHVLSDARCLFGWCEDAGLVARSPVPRKLLPRVQERPPDRLTDKEAVAVAATPDPYGFVCRFGLASGLRWGEMVRAQVGHVEGMVLVVDQTKTGKVRRVPLPSAFRAELVGRIGRIVPFTDSENLAKIVRRESGLSHFHAHQLRHTFACQWLERGGSLAALQQILGHASIVTTQRYARLSDEHVRAEAERLDAASGNRS